MFTRDKITHFDYIVYRYFSLLCKMLIGETISRTSDVYENTIDIDFMEPSEDCYVEIYLKLANMFDNYDRFAIIIESLRRKMPCSKLLPLIPHSCYVVNCFGKKIPYHQWNFTTMIEEFRYAPSEEDLEKCKKLLQFYKEGVSYNFPTDYNDPFYNGLLSAETMEALDNAR